MQYIKIMTVTEFYKTFEPIAKQLEIKYKIPYLFGLAQSALETGYGKHAAGNMYFGIKASADWKGKTQILSTKEFINGEMVTIKQTFRKYNNAQESWEDWAKLLVSKVRYAPAFQYKDTILFAKAIAKAGYATDPNYSKKIAEVIEVFKKKNLLKPLP